VEAEILADEPKWVGAAAGEPWMCDQGMRKSKHLATPKPMPRQNADLFAGKRTYRLVFFLTDTAAEGLEELADARVAAGTAAAEARGAPRAFNVITSFSPSILRDSIVVPTGGVISKPSMDRFLVNQCLAASTNSSIAFFPAVAPALITTTLNAAMLAGVRI
jgi:hypothetical protein